MTEQYQIALFYLSTLRSVTVWIGWHCISVTQKIHRVKSETMLYLDMLALVLLISVLQTVFNVNIDRY
jgi:hypothetical protein